MDGVSLLSLRNLLLTIWSAPWGLVSLAIAAIFRTLGWIEYGYRDGVVWTLRIRGPLARYVLDRGFGGFSFGWVVFLWEEPDLALLRHEHRHVDQSMAMGVLWPFAYMACHLAFGYEDNPLEVDARAHE
jgi:hypothetical protein